MGLPAAGLTAGAGLVEAMLEAQQAERDRLLKSRLTGLDQQAQGFQQIASGTQASTSQILESLSRALG